MNLKFTSCNLQDIFSIIYLFPIPIALIICLIAYGLILSLRESKSLIIYYWGLLLVLFLVLMIWFDGLYKEAHRTNIDLGQTENHTQIVGESSQKDSKKAKADEILANEIPKMIVGGLVTAILTLIVFGIIINNRPPSQADKDKEALKLLTDFISGTEFTKARLTIQKHLSPWRCRFDDKDPADVRLEKFKKQHLVEQKFKKEIKDQKGNVVKSDELAFYKFENFVGYWETKDPRELVEKLVKGPQRYQITYEDSFFIRKVLGFFWVVNTASEKGMIDNNQDIFNYHYAWYWQNIFRFRFASIIDNGMCRPFPLFFNQGKQGKPNHFFGVARSEFQAFLRIFLSGKSMEMVKEAFEIAVIYLYVTVCCEIWHLHQAQRLILRFKKGTTESVIAKKFPKFDESELSTFMLSRKKFFYWKLGEKQTIEEQIKIKHILEYFNELHFILKDCVEASCFDGLKDLASDENAKKSFFDKWILSINNIPYTMTNILNDMTECVCSSDNDFKCWRASFNINSSDVGGAKNYVMAMLCASVEYHFATEDETGTKSNKGLRPMYNPIGLYK